MKDQARRSGLSSEAREAILAQHQQIRDLASKVSDLAGAGTTDAEGAAPLRTKALALCATLDEHLRFEESLLEAALMDVIARGAELHAEIERDHQRQRTFLSSVMAELGRTGPPTEELLDRVRRFVDILLRDLEAEEQLLLSADVDALMADGEAGD
jgi:hypothetical protein